MLDRWQFLQFTTDIAGCRSTKGDSGALLSWLVASAPAMLLRSYEKNTSNNGLD